MPFGAAISNDAFVPCWDARVPCVHAGMVRFGPGAL